MEISGYGVRLTRLKEDHIETVRQWRNSATISRYMEYQIHITAEMQQQWFGQLRLLEDFYFVVEYMNEPIGLIHTSHIDWFARSGNAGLFIYDERYLSTHIPVLASLSMVDALFGMFPLRNIYAKVMKDNAIAVRYNLNLGFRLEGKQENKPFQRYVLAREAYYAATTALRQSAKSVAGGNLQVQLPNELFEALKQRNLVNKELIGIDLSVEGRSVPL